MSNLEPSRPTHFFEQQANAAEAKFSYRNAAVAQHVTVIQKTLQNIVNTKQTGAKVRLGIGLSTPVGAST